MKRKMDWTPEKKRLVFDMIEKGMTGKEIADVMGVTRGSIMGLKFREYNGEVVRKKPPPAVKKDEEKLLKAGTHWRRKCLKCRKEMLLERGSFLCKDCKESPIFGGII